MLSGRLEKEFLEYSLFTWEKKKDSGDWDPLGFRL